jgi:hypothetical protein
MLEPASDYQTVPDKTGRKLDRRKGRTSGTAAWVRWSYDLLLSDQRRNVRRIRSPQWSRICASSNCSGTTKASDVPPSVQIGARDQLLRSLSHGTTVKKIYVPNRMYVSRDKYMYAVYTLLIESIQSGLQL